MKYHWGEWTLDRDAGLLTQRGRSVDVSRKVLECIGHLIAHRDRVVGYDELIRKVWGHDNVTNHQLSQVILSARRQLGDDGQAQRLIRTAPGLGYQWVGVLGHEAAFDADDTRPAAASSTGVEPSFGSATISPRLLADAEVSRPQRPADKTAPGTPIQETAPAPSQPPPQSPTPPPPPPPNEDVGKSPVTGRPAVKSAIRLILAASVLCLLGFGAYRWLWTEDTSSAFDRQSPIAPANGLEALEAAMRRGDFETVREGLAVLPPSKAESPDAMLIAMELAQYRGRFERAQELFDQEMALAKAAEDPIWQAKLLNFNALLITRTGGSATQQLAPVETALELLAPLGEDAAPQVTADTLYRRAAILVTQGRYEEALRDISHSGELYDKIGEASSINRVRVLRARIWMRTGRLEDALRSMREVAEEYEKTSDKIGTLTAYNTISRIQMELLRWDDALETSDQAMALLREIPEIERRKRVLQLRAQVLSRTGQLHRAQALLEELDAPESNRDDDSTTALHLLEGGRNVEALKVSADSFARSGRDDPDDILLDTREGKLLIWVIAAQRIADSGQPLPKSTPAQIDALRNPRSISGIIASGRWAMAQNDNKRAEALLREALDESRRKGMRYHMVLASAPLLDLLLEQGRSVDGKRLLDDVRAFDPERTDKDFDFAVQRWKLAMASADEPTAKAMYARMRSLAGGRPIPASPDPNSPRTP